MSFFNIQFYIYLAICAFVIVLLVDNLFREKRFVMQLHVFLVIIPFVLRLLLIK